jgi:hypothetical protein
MNIMVELPTLPSSIALLKRCRGKSMLRLEMVLKSGMAISAPMTRASAVINPSIWRKARWNTCRINRAVSIAIGEYSTRRPFAPVFATPEPVN